MIKVIQDPDAQLPYAVDWSAWLEPGEVLVDSQWFIAPAGPALQEETLAAGKTATVWVSGLTVGIPYTLTNRVTSSSSPLPKIDDRSLILLCEDR